jgi:predicted ATPase
VTCQTLFKTIRLREFLSYGPSAQEISLGRLNVLIGPNGSGKSNLIEAISVLQATPRDLPRPIREGGGVAEWLWKGPQARGVAEIEVTTECPIVVEPLRYRLSFAQSGQRFDVTDEAIENAIKSDPTEDDVYFYYRYQQGRPVLNTRTRVEGAESQGRNGFRRTLKKESVSSEQSILSQKVDADLYPEMTWLGEQYKAVKLYREWSFGRNTILRKPQQVDLPGDFLLDDGSNMGLILNDLLHRGIRKTIIEKLRHFYDGIEDVTTKVLGGTIQVFLHEEGVKQPIPATRLSDGTLRYLCLLCVLLHPDPPSLVCIEEPELGIHPDILHRIGEMLVGASERTQLIVTTHSDVLVSALSETPDSVIVCERGITGTNLMRLEKDKLQSWLKDYSLGEIWRMGEIGGNRW